MLFMVKFIMEFTMSKEQVISAAEYPRCDEYLGFISDGCSGGFSAIWELITGEKCPFNPACLQHDCAYFLGDIAPGNTRVKADSVFRKALWDGYVILDDGTKVQFQYKGSVTGYKQWWGKACAWPMWAAVRLGGWKYWPTSYRWGFGEEYEHYQ